ncbi:hypothetical protein AtubIFM57258_006992 [Aspergillus tubingensis]|nr:hypothetical protein AtubIFM57258_006992 [Aspergillus tubingensis]
MPKELSDAYKEIYARISGVHSQKQLVDCAFKWVMCSYWPVSPEYIVTAVQFLEDRNAPEEEININTLLGLCQNLLVIDESTGYLRFPHASVVEFIEKELWDTRAAYCYAAKACLQSLMVAHDEEEDDTTYTSERTARAFIAANDQMSTNISGTHLSNHFHTYCWYYWMHHVQHYETLVSDPEDFDTGLVSLLKRFLNSPTQSGPFYQRWYRCFLMDYPYNAALRYYEWIARRFAPTYEEISRGLSPPTLPILAMCSFGFHSILHDWWESAGALYNTLKNSEDESLLILAVKTNHLPICQRLVKNGAPIDYEGDNGNALYLAAREGHRDIVEFLVQNKASVNHVNRYHGTALTAAVSFGNLDIARLLIEKGAGMGINFFGETGDTPLGTAVVHDRLEAIQFLLDEGADINQPGNGYGSPLAAAVSCSTYEVVQLLLNKGADVNNFDDMNGSPLGAAAYSGRLEVVQLLLNKGADVNNFDDMNGCPLGAAARLGGLEVVQLLVEYGAVINQLGGCYGSPLAAAAAGGKLEVARFLVSKGANVNLVLPGSYGSALAVAVCYGELEISQFLIENGADINMPPAGQYGRVLTMAAFRGLSDVVRLLVDKGAMMNLPLDNGLVGSELAGAAWAGNVEIVEYLISKGAAIDRALSGFFGSALAAAAYGWKTDSVRLLIDNGASVHLQLETGSVGSALAAAAAAGRLETVMLLIEKGADVNQTLITGKHKTALSAASYWGQVECVKALLDAGAIVDLALVDFSPENPVETPQYKVNSFSVEEFQDVLCSFPWGKRNEPQMTADKHEVLRILENHAKTHC